MSSAAQKSMIHPKRTKASDGTPVRMTLMPMMRNFGTTSVTASGSIQKNGLLWQTTTALGRKSHDCVSSVRGKLNIVRHRDGATTPKSAIS
jgi:hypothetical protein